MRESWPHEENIFFTLHKNLHSQVVTSMSLIGGKTYTLFGDLLTPDKLDTKSFQEIITTLQQQLLRP